MSTTLDGTATRKWVDEFLDALERERAALGDLDRKSGDGDFGTNVETSLRRARDDLAMLESAVPAAPFASLSKAFLGTGGTSGLLFGMWFRELASAGAEVELDLRAVSDGVSAGTEAVRRLGGADVGDKTMIDAMQPATDVLAGAAGQGDPLLSALDAAALAARRGADTTAAMTAHRGRASYVGEASRGVLDPGAVVVALFFEAAGALRA